jgi:anti-sigma regulatory factor (Ser/Thr protein kinase)
VPPRVSSFAVAGTTKAIAVEDFHASYPCEVSRLRELRVGLAEWCDDREIDSDIVILATHEAAANAIKHACRSFEVSARLEDETVLIEVRDSGRKPADGDALVEQQIGLSLIRVLMDHVEIRDAGTMATIRMMRTL